MSTFTDRLEAAATKADAASDIAHQWANGDENTEVPTESGPLPSIKKFVADNATNFTKIAKNAAPNYVGNLVKLPPEFDGIQVAIDQDFGGQFVGLIYDESDPASSSENKTTYYIDPSVGGGGSGLTPEDPMNSLLTLFDLFSSTPPTTDIQIVLKDGIYDRSRSPLARTWSYHHNLSITAENEAIFTSADLGTKFTWAEDDGVYSTSRSAVLNVWDAAVRDYRGIPLWMDKTDTLADCQSTPGTWYTDGSTVWVHHLDGRQPDENTLLTLDTGSFEVVVRDGKTFFTENVKYMMTNSVNKNALRVLAATGDTAYMKAINCAFCGSYTRNGLGAEKIQTYLRDCTASYNGFDGFNYHDDVNNVQAVAIEVGCHAYANGTRQTGTNNGSTAHDGMRVIRCNTVCYDNYGPNIVDVNGCYSFNINCYAAKSTRPDGVSKANFYFDNVLAASNGKAWLIGCGGSDSLYDISTDAGFQVFVRGWKGAPVLYSSTEITIY